MIAHTTYIRLEVKRGRQGKWICPLCGTGNWQDHWYEEHRRVPHVYCKCERWFQQSGLRTHLRKCPVA